MSELKPNYNPAIKTMSLEQAIASRMTEAEYKQYLEFHQIYVTRTDD